MFAFATCLYICLNTGNAVDTFWAAAPGDPQNWNVPSNWSTGAVPGTGDIAFINNAGIAFIDATMALNPNSVTLGQTGGSSGRIIMTGGSLTTAFSDLRIGGNGLAGPSGTGTFDQIDGTVALSGGNVNVGIGIGGVGTYNLSGGSLTLLSSNIFAVGNRSTGTVDQTGGVIYVRGSRR